MTYDIELEKKVINLFGYKAINTNIPTKWLVLDENNKVVGSIEYKKVFQNNKDKETIFGYVLKINDSNISCNNIRTLKDDPFNYSFYYKIGEEDFYLKFGSSSYTTLSVCGKQTGRMDFNIGNDSLYFSYKSKTDNFDILETIIYEKGQKYGYTICYISNANKEEEETLTLDVLKPKNDEQNLIVVERKYKNRKCEYSREVTVEGTIYEAIKKHEMGIESFSHFRYLINQVLPFPEEVITSLTKDKELSDEIQLIINGDIKKRERKDNK